MNKMIGVTLFAACVFSMTAAPTAKAAENYTAKVYADSLNVRSEAAKNADVVGSIKDGVLVTVTDEQHGWLKIKAGQTSGWVAGYYLKKVNRTTVGSTSTTKKVTPTSTSSSANITSGNGTTKASVTANSLRIRSGPGTQYKVL